MKNSIFKSDKQLSFFIVFYLSVVMYMMRCTTILFKWFKLPGLSRVLSVFSFIPSMGALRTIEFNDNGTFTFPIFDYYYNMFFLSGRDYERELLDLCEKVNVEYVFFDGGANLGYIGSSFIHLTKYCTSLVAIEPNTMLKDILEQNVLNAIQSSNRESFRYEIISNAISEETCSQQFFEIGRHAGSSLSSNGTAVAKGVYINTISLNDLVENYTSNDICFFKLDLEGSEFDALRSFKYFNRSIIAIEVLDFQKQRHFISNLCREKYLDAFMYVDKWVNLTTIKTTNHFGKGKISKVGLNLLLVPRSLKDKVNV